MVDPMQRPVKRARLLDAQLETTSSEVEDTETPKNDNVRQNPP